MINRKTGSRLFVLFGLALGSLLGPHPGYTQDFNPPFPRIGQITFFNTNAGGSIWKNHDLVVLRYYLTGTAEKLRADNPDCIILATNDEIAEGREGRIGPYPEEWMVRTASGDLVGLWADVHLMDVTDYCPRVQTEFGNLRYNEYLPLALKAKTDYGVFDGTFFDYWTTDIWTSQRSQADLDRNGVADMSEGRSVPGEWNRGNRKLLENLRAALPGKPILAHEATSDMIDVLNGVGDENWRGKDWNHFFTNVLGRFKNAVSPTINFLEGAITYKDDNQMDGVKDRFDFVRFGLATACLGDAYFGVDDGSYSHRFTFLYDEFEANLGYPTGSHETIRTGVYVRYFDNGLVIANASGGNVTVNASDLQGGPYFRFKGGQDPDFNNGSQFTSVQLSGAPQTEHYMKGDGIILLKEPATLVTEIVIDNEDINMTSPGSRPARTYGDWQDGFRGYSAYAIRFGWGGWSVPFVYSSPGNGENRAEYVPTIGVAGNYEVFEWHLDIGGERDKQGFDLGTGASNVPFTITHGGGQTQGTVNQTVNNGQWNSLGVFHFNVGTSGKVVITNKANGHVVADAIKFVYRGQEALDTVPPNPPRNLGSSEETEHSIRLTWGSPAPASDGDAASYYKIFRSGNLVWSTPELTFVDDGLDENTTYSYEVYSYDGYGNQSTTPATGSFTTAADLVAPEIMRVSPLKVDLVEVQFSEPVTRSSATNIQNYSISGDVSVTAADLDELQKIVRLTTTPHTAGNSYTITISNINDFARVPNTITANSTSNYLISDSNFSLVVSADNGYSVYVNGVHIGQDSTWENAELYQSLPLLSGRNVIAIQGENKSGVAGIVSEILGPDFSFYSSPSWKYSLNAEEGWKNPGYNDSSWQNAISYGLAGTALPWQNYHSVEGITQQEKVHWIWSENPEINKTVYFRFSFDPDQVDIDPPSPPQGVTVRQ